jgi:hypothetical protein
MTPPARGADIPTVLLGAVAGIGKSAERVSANYGRRLSQPDDGSSTERPIEAQLRQHCAVEE